MLRAASEAAQSRPDPAHTDVSDEVHAHAVLHMIYQDPTLPPLKLMAISSALYSRKAPSSTSIALCPSRRERKVDRYLRPFK